MELPTPSPGESAGELRLAGRLVQPALNRVVGPDGTHQIEPKAMEVLLCLAARAGAVVTREELLAEVWEGAFVTDDVLTRAIGQLRRVFGDDPVCPRTIETIRKRGYRLIAEIERAGAEAAPSLPASRHPAWGPPALATAALVLLLAAALLAWLRHGGPGGGERRPLRLAPVSSDPGNELDPAVSPDGTRVAYAWNGGSGRDYDLWVRLLDQGPPLRLTQAPGIDLSPAWSPDGSRIAFSRIDRDDCALLEVSALGGGERRLGACGDRETPEVAWSPDGRWLALSRPDPAAGGAHRLELAAVEGTERRALTAPAPGTPGDYAPAFSPDGRSVAFVRGLADGVEEVFVVPAAGGAARQLTHDNASLEGVDWLAGGRELVFSSDRAGTYSLWRVDLAGGEPRLVAGGGAKMKHPSAARGRDVVVFESWIYEINLWRLPLAPPEAAIGAAEPLAAASHEWTFEPQVSPDGRRVAFGSTRSGSYEIWVAGSDGAEPRRLTSFGGPHVGSPRWSPDGARLVFTARPGGQADLWTVDAAGGVPARLTHDPADELAPSWSADGRGVYFASRRSGDWQVWRIDAASGEERQVTGDGGFAALEAPAGAALDATPGGPLFYTRPDRPGIWSLASAGAAGEPTLVTSALAPGAWASWTLTARGHYFRDNALPDAPIVFLAFGSPGPPVVAAAVPDMAWPGLAVSPDDRFLVYARIDRREANLMRIENPR